MKRSSILCLLLTLVFPLVCTADLADIDSIFVREIRLTGMRLLSDAEIEDVINAYVNRNVRIEELMAARKALTERIIDKGYVSSGVTLPDQEIRDGIVEFNVVSSGLTHLQIEGNKSLSEEYIARIVQQNVSGPLNIADLNRSLQEIERLNLISSVNGRLIPGTKPGESTLSLFLDEEPARNLTISGDNYRSPGLGEHRGIISISDDSLTGRGDSLLFAIDFGEGAESYFGSYERMLNRSGTRLSGYFGVRNFDIIEKPFDELDIETKWKVWGLRVAQPLISGPDRNLSGFVGFENDHVRSELLGESFSFSLGEKDGQSETSHVAVGVDWAERIGMQRFALRATIKQGLRVLGATVNSGGLPDSQFTVFIGQAQYIRDFDRLGDAQLSLRALAQFTDDALLPQHKMPIGGRYSVRGYRENQLVRDNGVAASAELKIPITQFRDELTFVSFVDYGRAWDELNELPSSEADDLLSAGIGFEWHPWFTGLDAELYYAHAFEEVDNPTNSNQERGFHYQVRYSRRF